MPSYTYATFSDAISVLGARLYDRSFQQVTQQECLSYLVESLRTWNALTSFWRSEMVFSLEQDNWWYDLNSVTGTIVPYTVTKFQLIQQVQNHLLEPPNPAVWTGSLQFSMQDLTSALQRRQDDTLGTTGCTLTRSLVNAPVQRRVTLADNVIDIRRVVWMPETGFGYSNKILKQGDMWASRAFNPYYTTASQGPPGTWMQNTEPPPSFDVDRDPPVAGNYEVITVDSGPVWNAGQDSLLNIPDDWTWVFKWGALMDLFSRESNAKDSLRAEYCRRRYQEGLALLTSAPTVLAVRLNNIPMAVDALRSGDDFNPLWQTLAAGAPTSAYVAGNLVAFGRKPNSSTAYSATVSVVQNAPVDGAFVQVARDDYDAIIDYAQHLAMIKQGGSEFAASISLYQNLQYKASQYNGKLKEMGFFSMPQMDLGNIEEVRNARYLPGTGPSVAVQ